MDTITKIKFFIKKLYGNKYFKFFVFIVFTIICLKKYSSLTNNIKNYSTKSIVQGKPEKINAIKYISSTMFAKEEDEKKAQEEKNKLDQIRQKQNEEKLIAEQKKQKEFEEFKKEFTPQNNKGTRTVKYNDKVRLKMIITNGDDFNIPMTPIIMDLQMINIKDNIFAKYVIGKNLNDVIIIPTSVFIDTDNLKKEMKKVEEKYKLNNVQINSSMFKESALIYRVKIVDIK